MEKGSGCRIPKDSEGGCGHKRPLWRARHESWGGGKTIISKMREASMNRAICNFLAIVRQRGKNEMAPSEKREARRMRHLED